MVKLYRNTRTPLHSCWSHLLRVKACFGKENNLINSTDLRSLTYYAIVMMMIVMMTMIKIIISCSCVKKVMCHHIVVVLVKITIKSISALQ